MQGEIHSNQHNLLTGYSAKEIKGKKKGKRRKEVETKGNIK